MRKQRLYWRQRGGDRRAYGDFRDLGGKREPLVAPGTSRATTDEAIAQVLLARRVTELEAARRGQAILGRAKTARFLDFARTHLTEKAKAGKTTELWLGSSQLHLERAAAFFGPDLDLAALTPERVRAWLANLGTLRGRGGRPLSGGTLRHHLNTLSNLYRRAAQDGFVLPGFNPATALMEKPSAARKEARWLEVPDAALLLEAARTVRLVRQDRATPYLHPLLATFMLTGGRRAEVLGLEVGDVNFDRKTVTFRPNAWRRLKTATSHRTVPLWPQLEAILRDYLNARVQAEVFEGAPGRALLFPGFLGAGERCLGDFRKALGQVCTRAGWKPGEITTKVFRHTYCAARLQTTDRGQEVGAFTVGREMGHGGVSLVNRVYGHLGEIRHRAEVVEYRIEAFEELLRARLAGLNPDTTPDTTAVPSLKEAC